MQDAKCREFAGFYIFHCASFIQGALFHHPASLQGLSSASWQYHLRVTARHPLSLAGFLLTCRCALALARAQQAPASRFDIVITGGRVVDGTGAPWIRADIGIAGDRIEAIGALQ